jgi:hypothetical protein
MYKPTRMLSDLHLSPITPHKLCDVPIKVFFCHTFIEQDCLLKLTNLCIRPRLDNLFVLKVPLLENVNCLRMHFVRYFGFFVMYETPYMGIDLLLSSVNPRVLRYFHVKFQFVNLTELEHGFLKVV